MRQRDAYVEDQERPDRGGRQRSPKDSERGMTTSGDRQAEEQGGDRWRGYIVPYRYYGPGYQGVGYYSVAYLGTDDEDQDAGSSGWANASGRSQGTSGGWRSSGKPAMGGQAGRGPKGYRRSDERITEDVNDRLTASDWLDASAVEVDVRDGEVSLRGTVPDRDSKRLAEDLAEGVPGVREVMNQLRVSTGEEARSDRAGSEKADREGSRDPSGGATSGTTSATGEAGSTNGNRVRSAASR
jgi:osmotically-inducible protein OsmY